MFPKQQIAHLTIESAAKFVENFKFKLKKLKVHQFPEINKFKIFVETAEQEEAVKIYDTFYKGKFDGVKSSVYFQVEESILKDYTIEEILRHEQRKRD